MATCRETVEGALRKLGKLGAGRSARTADLADGLASLKGLYRSLINSGAFGRLRDVIPTADYTANENERIIRNTDDVASIELPEFVSDVVVCGDPCDYGSRWVPPGSTAADRPPRDCSVVVINDTVIGTSAEYLYDGQRATWIDISALELDDQAPLSVRDADGLKARLALQMADEYGGQVPPLTVALARSFQSGLVNRWSMPREQTYGTFV